MARLRTSPKQPSAGACPWLAERAPITTLSGSAMQAYNPLKPGGITQLYRVSEVAQMLGVHPNTVRKWVREEILRPVKVPGSDYSHFTLDELNRLRQQVGLPLVEDQE
jgi:excisionase family DNA binding protein